jgi:chromosome segregation ATPase
MPHVKSIRLVNVHFNNATQFYDDFTMELGGRNTTYDLENGGGKSLLLLMVLQTVLPKSYLRREKPLSLLFQGGKDRTSHVAVEWMLEEGSGYKYLLTGFSGRKRRGAAEPAGANSSEEEEGLQAADIEHLNWCVFYNDNRVTGIRLVPLLGAEAGKKSYAGFEEIRKYIQLIKQKGVPAEVFDRIDRYQSYISAHHLLFAEWNIIRGINSGENNIESYFRQNATSRKLIENQFVKIVEDVEALNKGEKGSDDSLLLADTLIEIRTRLNEYLRLKGHMAEYEKIKEYYEEFGQKNEEFLKAYQEYEACKILAAAIHKLIKNKLKTLEEKKTATKAKLDCSTTGSIEGQQLKRLLEAGLVNHEKEKLVAVLRRLEAEKDQLAAGQRELEKRLNHLLTLEGYGEYRKVKAKVREIRQRLQTLETNEDSVQTDYRVVGGKLRYLTDKLFQELDKEEKKTKATRDELEKEKENAQQERIDNEKIAAKLEGEMETLIQQETSLQAKLKGLHDFFLKRGEMDAFLLPEQFLRHLEEERSRYLSELDTISERIKFIDSELQDLGLLAVKTEGEINRKKENKKPLESWLEAWQFELSGLEKKAAGFGKNTVLEYKEGLRQLIHKESLSKLEKEIESKRLRRKKQLSEDRGYYVPNEEILSLASQLGAKCEFVQTGIDWIARAEPEERENILGQMPYLPFSVIIDRGSFAKLKNGRLKPDFSSDYPVPLVNLEAVRLMNDGSGEDVYYFCGFAGLLLDSGQYHQHIQSMEATIKKLDREIITADLRINELNQDLSMVDVFYGTYPQAEIENKIKMVKTVTDEIAIMQERLYELNEKKNNFLKEKKVLNEKLDKLAKLAAEHQEKIEKLKDSRETGDNLAGIREQLSRRKKEFATVQEKIAKIKAADANLKQQCDLIGDRQNGLRLELHDVKKEMEQMQSFTEVENTLPIAKVRAEYKALRDIVSGRNTEESTLRSDLEDSETRLDALKGRMLRDYGGDLEELEKGEEEGLQIIIPTQSMITELRQDIDTGSQKLKAASERAAELARAIQKMEGKLEEILKVAGADLRSDLPRYDSESRYQQEIEQVEQLIKSYAEEIKRANEELERIKEEYSGLNNQKEDYEAFMEREEVAADGQAAPEMKDYRQFEKEYRRLQDNIRRQSEKWDDRLKTIQAESVHFIIREPLQELGKISKPDSAAQCLDRKKCFTEYIAIIEEKMQKIDRDIRQLESYQEDFIRRCIQRAELVLGHLRKLEPLSRIEVYGRRTSMIELKLQEFEARDKHLRMKAHIDGIVREIGEEGEVDRKRIAAKLSTKELLAQIVNMDKAAVRLYKIESIPENSRFYRWETAIGSEGQNNSLYFIFAACLISFIRMLSVTNTAVRTKKVIIADNPFGATSAVYLWNPMFKIMQHNDIQLIAPGHRIPREITSMFGVSYLLNQDILQDGRMRVVIKDVRIEEDEEVFRYIDSEQLSLF